MSFCPIGPRLDQSRPMDKQSVRSYPGDRESVRSGRRSRRGDDSSSGYSDNERRYRRSVSKLGSISSCCHEIEPISKSKYKFFWTSGRALRVPALAMEVHCVLGDNSLSLRMCMDGYRHIKCCGGGGGGGNPTMACHLMDPGRGCGREGEKYYGHRNKLRLYGLLGSNADMSLLRH